MRKSTNVTLTVVTAMGLTAHGQQLPPVNSNPCPATPQINGVADPNCGQHGSRGPGVAHKKRGGFGAIGARFKGGG
jgi:hypothetical protein